MSGFVYHGSHSRQRLKSPVHAVEIDIPKFWGIFSKLRGAHDEPSFSGSVRNTYRHSPDVFQLETHRLPHFILFQHVGTYFMPTSA